MGKVIPLRPLKGLSPHLRIVEVGFLKPDMRNAGARKDEPEVKRLPFHFKKAGGTPHVAPPRKDND
jgi:hypothetical protein